MINSIELTNWKTHGSTKLHFSKGTNILIGQMGAGKSSIMDAISFALFGTFPAIKNRRVSVSDLIRSRPDQKKSAKIRLSFEIGDDSYIVEREIYLDKPPKATLQKNGAYLQSQPERVTEEVEKALRMDYDLFSRAIYSEQNRLDYFLELRASDRKKQIDNLLGLDRFANALENGTSLTNRIKDMIEEGRKTAEGFDIEGQKKQLAKLDIEREKLVKERKTVLEGIEKLADKGKEMDARLREMKEKYNKKITIAREIAELRSKGVVLEKEIAKIDAEKLGILESVKKYLKEAESRLEGLKKRAEETIAAMQQSQTKLGKLQNEMDSIEKETAEKEKLLESIKGKERRKIEEELEEEKRGLEKLESEIASAIAQKEEAEKAIGELEKHISKCPVCERDLSQEMKDSLLVAKKNLMKRLAEKAEVMQEKQKESKKEAEELNKLLNRIALVEEKLKSHLDLDERRKKAEKELEKAKEEGLRSKKEVDLVNEDMDKANAEFSKLTAAKTALERRESHLIEKKKAEEAAAKKERDLREIDIDEKKLEEMQKEFTGVSSEISGQEASGEAIGKALEEKNRQMEERRSEIVKIETLYEDIKTKKGIVENLVKFNNSLQETQAQLRNRLVGSINSIMQQIWPELYPYQDYPNVELTATEGDYILKVCTYRGKEEVWEEVDSTASGGERSIASLAMRVAFALVLVPNLRWLILDEPTHNIDQLGINRFVSVFNEKLPEIVEQIFIITHDEQLKQVSNGKVYMLGRNKGENGETVAEEL